VKKVIVRGVDGSERILALVRRDGGHAYVCPLHRAAEAEAGDESSIVGFPGTDVRALEDQPA
jgi:hypothetical protein